MVMNNNINALKNIYHKTFKLKCVSTHEIIIYSWPNCTIIVLFENKLDGLAEIAIVLSIEYLSKLYQKPIVNRNQNIY